jgi:4-oxalocrotonate tautomerase
MPVVKIELWKGRNKEQKRKLVEKVTSAVVDSISCPAESVQVIISEVDKEHWGIGGHLASDTFPEAK